MARPAGSYKPRGNILGYDGPNGTRPIFAYIQDGPRKGIPCCGAKYRDSERYCKNVARFENGRCRVHGGQSISGREHPSFRGGQYAKAFRDQSTVKMMMDALDDPQYTSLKDEMALNAVELQKLTLQFNGGLDPDKMQRLYQIMEEIERLFFSKQVMAFIDVMKQEGIPVQSLSRKVEEAVLLLREGVNEDKLMERIGQAVERRRKLTETEVKRLQIERNNMPADQVVNLFKQLVGVVTKVFAKDPVGIRAFAYEVDQMSGVLAGGQEALQGRPGVAGMVDPKSALTQNLERELIKEDAIEVDFEDLSAYKPTKRKLNFG